MRSTGNYTPQFIQVLMNRDEPPELVDVTSEHEPDLVEVPHAGEYATDRSYSDSQELMQPLRVQRNFGDLSRNIALNSRAELQRNRIRQLEAELAKCSHIQKQCEQYETITENLKSRIKQLQRKLLQSQEKLRQANVDRMTALRQQDSNSNKVAKLPIDKPSLQEQLEVAKRETASELYRQTQKFLKERISQFIDSMKNERLSKRLESIIEDFLNELLQINQHTVKSRRRGDSRERPRGQYPQATQSKLSTNQLIGSLSRSYNKQELREDLSVQFRMMSTNKKSIAEETSMMKLNDLSVRDTSIYADSREDRDRSKSQRRRKIFA